MASEIQIFLLAMAPIGELRVSIPVGLTVYNLNLFLVYFISVIGNLVPVILLLLFLKPISKWLSQRFEIFQKFFSWIFKRAKKKYNSRMEKYGYPALIIFVAIPLPVTGGWTASLIAFLFGIPLKKAFSLIALGTLTAGLIVSLITRAGITIEKYFGLQALLGLLLTVGVSWLIYYKIKNKNYEKN